MAVQSEDRTRGHAPGARTHAPGRADGVGSRAPGPRLLGRAAPYLLLLPAALATAVLLVGPLVRTVLLSLQNLNRRQLILHLTEWDGLRNYRDQLSAPEFWHTAGRSVVFTAAGVMLIMAVGTLVGLLLDRLGRRLRLLLSLGLVLAWAMPVVAGTTVFSWLFDQRYGVVDWLLAESGWPGMAHFDWFGGQASTFFVIVLLIVWGSVPFVALTLYAGLTTIPAELYEAARLDGAGAYRIFTTVVFPSLRPFFLATTFLEVIWVFKCFTQVYALNAGGPQRLTETLPVYAFVEGVGNQHYGVGAAIAVLTVLMLGVLMAYHVRIIVRQEDAL